MMTREMARSLRLTANDFGIEVEMSAEIARQRTLPFMNSASAITAGPMPRARRSTEGWAEGAVVRVQVSLQVTER